MANDKQNRQAKDDSMTSSHVDASPSSSLVKESKNFDAFISHAGEQKQSVALFLYEELTRSDANAQRNLNPFLDEVSIPKGSNSHNVMNNAMQTAPIGVFVLSPEFVFKKWPMKELNCFLDRVDQQQQQQEKQEETQKTTSAFETNDDEEATNLNDKSSDSLTKKNSEGHKKGPMPVTIIPVFYELSWEDCNLNKNAFWEKYGHYSDKFKFAQRVERQEVTLDSVLDTLHRVSIISGVRNEKGEHQVVQDVTKRIHELWDEYHGIPVPKTSVAKWFILGTIVLLLIVILTVTMTLLVGGGSDDPGVQLTAAPATSAPTSTPTMAPTISLQNREWVQVGLDVVDGRATYVTYGDALALSQDGQTMIVGDPRGGQAFVFRYNYTDNRWNPLGEALASGISSFDSVQFGFSVDISASGSIVAIGARYQDAGGLDRAGQVAVYEYTNSGAKWQQLGSKIIGQSANDWLGSSVSLSWDGHTVACGGDGFLAMYRYDGSNWQPLGNNNAHIILGKSGPGAFGSAVSVSGDGTRFLAGSYHITDNLVVLPGYVRVYELMSETLEWSQVSNEINGPAGDTNFALNLALSGDGKTFAVSGYQDDGDVSTGYVQIYFQQESNGQWVPRGERLVGETRGGDFGESVALSDDGLVVAVGDRWSNSGGSQSGAVYLYFWNTDSNMWDSWGNPIGGQSRNDELGWRVALDQNGTRVIASRSPSQDDGGAVRVFDFLAGTNMYRHKLKVAVKVSST